MPSRPASPVPNIHCTYKLEKLLYDLGPRFWVIMNRLFVDSRALKIVRYIKIYQDLF